MGIRRGQNGRFVAISTLKICKNGFYNPTTHSSDVFILFQKRLRKFYICLDFFCQNKEQRESCIDRLRSLSFDKLILRKNDRKEISTHRWEINSFTNSKYQEFICDF
jgi:hypothetical protein